VGILTLRLAELKKIYTLDAPFTDMTGRKELRFVTEDIFGGFFPTLKITEAHKKVKVLGITVSWVPTMRSAENCASFRTFATGWIPVKETSRSYSGNTSASQEQSTWKCIQLR
jgi:hypothetical protein